MDSTLIILNMWKFSLYYTPDILQQLICKIPALPYDEMVCIIALDGIHTGSALCTQCDWIFTSPKYFCLCYPIMHTTYILYLFAVNNLFETLYVVSLVFVWNNTLNYKIFFILYFLLSCIIFYLMMLRYFPFYVLSAWNTLGVKRPHFI